MDRLKNGYLKYTAAISQYADAPSDDDLDHFLAIATTGDSYFNDLKIIADAILANNLDPQARDSTLIPKIKEAVESNLEDHYKTLKNIAKKKGFTFKGTLKRENYQSLYTVLEKYG